MRYRRLDDAGDYVFGGGQQDFYIDQPEAVAQSILTRLQLWEGQWFYDTSEGTAWATQVLGERTRWTRDTMVFERVLSTPGVTDVLNYYSTTDPNARQFTAAMAVNTLFGPVELAAAKLPGTVPPLPTQVQAQRLGITGGTVPATDVVDTPADLTQPGQQYIRDFAIRRVDAGTF